MPHVANNSVVIVSWVKRHGRSDGLSTALDGQAVYPPLWTFNVRPVPLRYLVQSLQTFIHLLRRRPSVVIVMQPPVPALITAWSAAVIGRFRVAGDLHSGTFNDPKWAPFVPLVAFLLRRGGFALVTGDKYASTMRAHGVETVILHDVLVERSVSSSNPSDRAKSLLSLPRPILVAPVSWQWDEPIDELVAAHEGIKGSLLITGDPPVEMDGRPNVVLTGFLPHSDYDTLVEGCDGIVALTTRDDTMQRGGYEAMILGKPLLTSDSVLLRRFFGDAAIYAQANLSDLQRGLKELTERGRVLAESMTRRRSAMLQEQAEAIVKVRRLIDGPAKNS